MNTTILSDWELLAEYNAALPRFNERRSTPGTFRKSSCLTKPDKTPNRPYGGRHMSVARLRATTPTRHYIPQMNRGDITM